MKARLDPKRRRKRAGIDKEIMMASLVSYVYFRVKSKCGYAEQLNSNTKKKKSKLKVSCRS